MKIQNYKNVKDYVKKELAEKEEQLKKELAEKINIEEAETNPFAKVTETDEDGNEITKFAFVEK